jgi:hypothetical protein
MSIRRVLKALEQYDVINSVPKARSGGYTSAGVLLNATRPGLSVRRYQLCQIWSIWGFINASRLSIYWCAVEQRACRWDRCNGSIVLIFSICNFYRQTERSIVLPKTPRSERKRIFVASNIFIMSLSSRNCGTIFRRIYLVKNFQ